MPETRSCGCCSLAADRHWLAVSFKNDIFWCVYSLAKRVSKTVRLKKRKTKTQRVSSRLHHAKYINISIWCLIFPPLTLTPLAPVAPIAELDWALPGQGHVVGVCYESATWSQRCLWGTGAPASWQGGNSDSIAANCQEARVDCTVRVTHAHTDKHNLAPWYNWYILFFVHGFSFFTLQLVILFVLIMSQIVTNYLDVKQSLFLYIFALLACVHNLCVFFAAGAGSPCSLIDMFFVGQWCPSVQHYAVWPLPYIYEKESDRQIPMWLSCSGINHPAEILQ